MAGIGAALEAHDDVGLFRQPVDDLALPFVAPLGADDDDIGHSRIFPLQLSKQRAWSVRKIAARSSRSCAQPKSRPGAARMRGTQPDNGSGLATQARTGLWPAAKPGS